MEILRHLTDVLRKRNPELASEGIIRPFNATLSHEYREEAMDQFRDGRIRILVCTDAAGMVRDCSIENSHDIKSNIGLQHT